MKAGWQLKRLDEVCEIARGGSPRPIKDFITDAENGVNWIKIGDTELGGRYISATKQKIRPEGMSKSRFVKKGSFLLSNSMSFGRPYILQIDGCIHDGWLVLEPDYSAVDQDYLYHVLSSRYVFDQFNRLAAGSTVRNLNIGLASKVSLPIPPLEEQKRIVAVLDAAFEGLDRARAHTEANLQNARDLFESSLANAMTGRWSSKRFDEVCVLQRGFDLPKRLRKQGQYDLVTSSGVKDTHSEFKVEGPGVATGRSGSIGKVFYVPNNFWPLNTALYIKEFHGNHPKFIWYFLRNFGLNRFATGAGVPTLNRNNVHGEVVQVPESPADQQHIVDQLDRLDAECGALQEQCKSKLKDLDDLRQSLLQKAFAGELS